MVDLSEVKRSNFAILLNNSRTLWPIDVKFSEWWIWVRRWTLLICDDARFKMVDLSEVKRSNFVILLNNSRTLWPIDVTFSGGWWIWVRRWTLLICNDARFKMADLLEVKRSNFVILLNNSGAMDIGFDQLIFNFQEWWIFNQNASKLLLIVDNF